MWVSPQNALSAEDPTPPPPPPPPGDQEVAATFCFVDIAGYTALTDTHGERAAADLVDGFTRLVQAAAHGRGVVQELSGDNAFLVFPDPLVAVQAIASLYAEVAGSQDFPMLRTGLHHGSALFRANRYFGSTINLAARTAAQAGGGDILCTEPVAQALASAAGADFSISPAGKFKLKNLPQAVDLYRIVLQATSDPCAIDPVCQMQVDTRHAMADGWFNGNRYWFCSLGCSRRFAQSPLDFV